MRSSKHSARLEGLHRPAASLEFFEDTKGLDRLLEGLYSDNIGDFRNYKRSSISRRVFTRLSALDISSYPEYMALLKADPNEYARLHSTLTVKVSEFFREPHYFNSIAAVLKNEYSLSTKGLRAWCCGCATGEEAYSLSILFSEHLSPENIALSRIFATDVDPEALESARRGEYRPEYMHNVDVQRRKRFFSEGSETMLKVDESLRRPIRFGTLNIVTGHGFSRIDILLCRNLFIYFNKKLQADVFAKLHYALVPGGLLVLGKAEVIPAPYASFYTRLEKRGGTYRKRRLNG